MKNSILVLLAFTSFNVFAWGKRGHQIVGENAALLVSSEPEAGFMRDRSFDFGYYANVPDIIWKRPKTYEKERNQHFMDMEHFDKAFAANSSVTKPFEIPRKDFEAKFPELKENAGRAYWRVREMNDKLTELTKQLRELPEPKGKARRAWQEKWLVLAGTMGHYIGDLAQPLHVTENYDGQLTGQKGIHAYFEDEAVDQLYPAIGYDVHKRAMKRWPDFKKKNADKSVLQLMEDLAKTSNGRLPELLKLDKGGDRADVKKMAGRYRDLIEDCLVDGVLTLAEIYRRQLGWKFDGEKFYFFSGEPEFIAPGATSR
ncbi:MAG TPA: hypothetical protein PKC28_03960 [Bdellovibrionales bacterium]|nr:hypothetical protein [Bdellovibrionales bacterium]